MSESGNDNYKNNNYGELHNYIRLNLLIRNHGEPVLRKLFVERYKIQTGMEWKSEPPEKKSAFLKNICKGKTLHGQQTTSIEPGDISQCDVTLLVFLVLQFQHHDSKNIDDENSCIEILRELRNELAHYAGKTLSSEDFDRYWSKAEKFCTYFGVSPEAIENIRTTSNLNGIQFEEDFLNLDNLAKSELLKEKGNEAMRNNNQNEAVSLYSKALLFTGLSKEQRGILYSNRSQAYFRILNHDEKTLSLDGVNEIVGKALEDAEMAVQLRPSWWKGYARVGQLFQFKKEYEVAIIWFDYALGLDPTLESVKNSRDECRYDRRKEDIKEHLDPLKNYLSRQEMRNKFVEERGPQNTIFDGTESENDYIEFQKLRLSSEDPKDKADAWVYMAHNYMMGDHVPRSMKMAALLFQKAADVGNIEAIYNLGLLAMRGDGVQRDIAKAVKLFEKAADHKYSGEDLRDIGIVDAKYAIGKCYHDGVGYERNYIKAAEWYQRASWEGAGEASNNLGILYGKGEGVEQNTVRKLQYAKLAVEQGCPIAMTSIYWCYLGIGDVDQAEIWFQRCCNAECTASLLEKKNFSCALKEAKESQRLCREKLAPNLNKAKIPSHKLMKHLAKQHFPEVQQIEEIYLKNCNPLPTANCKLETRHSLFDKIIDCKAHIRQKAEEGGKYAQQIYMALNYLCRALKGLLTVSKQPGTSSKCDRSIILEDIAKALELAHFVVAIPESLMPTYRQLVQEGLKHEKSEIEYFARVCYPQLLMNSLDESEKFTRISKSLFPNKSYFYDMQSCNLGFLKKYKDGAQVAQQAIALFHDVPEHYYNKAVHLKLGYSPELPEKLDLKQRKGFKIGKEETKTCECIIEAYTEFLNKAPRDHRKVPESYYAMAQVCAMTKNEVRAEEYYQLGLKSEKCMLPCFIPYDSSNKGMIESFRNLYLRINKEREALPTNYDKILEPDAEEIEKTRKLQSDNPKRIIVSRQHREKLKNIIKDISSNSPTNRFLITQEPLHTQRSPLKKTQLEEITFEQMDPTKDHVYKNNVISLTIMEDSIFKAYPSIHSVVMDKNGDFQLIYFYNLDNDKKTIRRNLRYGARIQVKHPYYRLTGDVHRGRAIGTGIRVDDPKSLVYLSEGTDSLVCRFCWKDDPQFSCAKCLRVKYCSKECQVQDWKLLRHDFICKMNPIAFETIL